jgi:hypothetical protein
MTRLGYRFIYKHEVDVRRDPADVVTLLASGELEKLPPGRVAAKPEVGTWTYSRLVVQVTFRSSLKRGFGKLRPHTE